jgi:RimJ/RimL family protein N-acetyltransferase
MELQPYTEHDMALTEACECDPVMMQHLGGAWPKERTAETHRRRLGYIAQGTWWFKIVPDAAAGAAAGTIGLWPTEWAGESGHEMGWMVLPAYQGRGVARAAGKLILERARADGRFRLIHAFPALSNAASNALCRTLGFTPLEECGIDYGGRPLKCRHWRLDLHEPE